MMLYIRQIVVLLVSLYTIRIVLNALGVEDYGIYAVIGGIVTFFSFLSNTMTSATQRFFSFALGQDDFERLKKTFTVNLVIYGAIAVIALALLETAGLWFVNEQLNVPPERLASARWVYHFAVLTFITTIFATPFMAIVIAHEDMQIYAYMSIGEAAIKLGVAFLLVYLPHDKLELYGVLIFAASVITSAAYITVCIRKYKECQFRQFHWDKTLFREIAGFTGWTMFGQISLVARKQGVTILLNQMFNPVVVAAKAVADSAAWQVNAFATNFNVSLYPPIVKSYAADEKKEMFLLIFRGSKVTFFLLWVFALPLLLEMETILQIWLKDPPPEAVLFTRLALVEALILSASQPIVTAIRAPGKIKAYELSLGSINIAIFVVSWFVLMMGAAAYSIFVVAIVASIIKCFVRLSIARTLIGFSIKPFLNQVVFPASVVVLLSAASSYVIHLSLPERFIFTCISILASVIIVCISMFFIGINQPERAKVRAIIINKIKRITY